MSHERWQSSTTMSEGHPDAVRLAEYVDRVLSAAEQRDVERHLAECADCRDAVADSVAFRTAEEGVQTSTGSSTRRMVWIGAALATAAAIALVAWIGRRPSASVVSSQFQTLIARLAEQPTRPIEARLTGGFRYAPLPPVVRGREGSSGSATAAPALGAAVQVALAAIERGAAVQPSVENRAAVGVANLIDGNATSAIETLEQVARERPDDPLVASDLAAAYLAAGVKGEGQPRFVQALQQAERALARRPGLGEAAFNRALALQYLGETTKAITAWTDVTRMGGDTGWIEEARQHLQALAAAP